MANFLSYSVCISDINEDIGKNTTKELRETFGENKVTFFACDVTKQEDWEALWNHAEDYFSDQVTLLVNNAGVGPQIGWKKCIDIMLVGTALGVFLAVEKMSTSKGKKGGRIINIASMAGLLEGMRNLDETGYSMAKFGVVALTRNFALRGRQGPWKKDGVKAMALCPWFAKTKLVTDATSIEALEEKFNQKGRGMPLKLKLLEVPEVADKFMQCLKLDKSGACYVVFPDCPLIDFPNVSYFWVFAMISFGQNILQPLNLKSFGMSTFIIFCILVCMFVYFCLSLLF